MTYINADHLHYPKGAALLAWHTTLDVCAIQDKYGAQRLVIRGDVFDLPADWFHPTQQVINICRMSKREAIKALATIRAKATISQDY